jgi:NADPH2:quinone reductase
MRAWQVTRYGRPEDALAQRDVALPEPGPGEARVRVEMAALGLPDVFMCGATYAFEPTLPFTPGQEVVGTVTARGEGGPEVGSRVLAVTAFFKGFGGFAEEAIVLAGSAFPAPASLPAADAAGFAIPFHTAWLGLVRRGALSSGDVVVVLGAAGGSGAAAVALAHALGHRVIAVARGAEKAAFCRELGADAVVDSEASDPTAAIRAANDGRGVDVVFDPVGGVPARQAMRALGSEGRLLAVGYASGQWAEAPTAALVQANTSIVGVYVGAYERADVVQAHEACMTLEAQGRLPSLVRRVVDFDAIPAALGEVLDRRSIGKVVARVGV